MHFRIGYRLLVVVLLGSLLVVAQETNTSQDGKGNTIISTRQSTTYTRPKISEELEKDRKYAFDLWKDHKELEALPWFEKLAKEIPNDAEVLEGLGACLMRHSGTIQDPEKEKSERIRVRQAFLQAQKLGHTSELMDVLLSMIPEDGGGPTFSTDAEVDKIMKRAEANFSAGRLDEAKQGYLQVLLIEPNNYSATLFIGDVYFNKKDYTASGEWFARAISIDPNHETAYRYWGDALAGQGNLAEARQKYIEAVVAEPYTRASWAGINKWTKYTNQPLTWYKIQSPNALQIKDSKNINIMIDSKSLEKKDGSSAWMTYEIARAAWLGEQFKKEYPNEKQYRHSLKEEFEALSSVAEVAESAEKNHENLNEDLKTLVKLKSAGFLEAYILFNAADAGIAQDYDGYRKDHRDKLIQYLSEIVVPPVPKAGS